MWQPTHLRSHSTRTPASPSLCVSIGMVLSLLVFCTLCHAEGEASEVQALADAPTPASGVQWLTPTEQPPTAVALVPQGEFLVASNSTLSRYASDGQVQWSIELPNTDEQFVQLRSLTAMADGGALVTGAFRGEVVLGAGEARAVTLTATAVDGFLARYSSQGTLIWAQQFSSPALAQGDFVAPQKDGSALLVGVFRNKVTFRNGWRKRVLRAEDDDSHTFIARYSASGALQWVRQPLSNGTVHGVATTPHGDLFVTGSFHGETEISFLGKSAARLSAPERSIFLVRYGPSGDRLWVRQAQAGFDDGGNVLAVSPDGDVLLTGKVKQEIGAAAFGVSTEGKVEAGPGAAVREDMFVARYSPEGKLRWLKTAGGPDDDAGLAVTVLPDRSVMVGGRYFRMALFGLDAVQEDGLVANGQQDLFIAHYQADGTLISVFGAGGIHGDQVRVMTAAPDGTALVGGQVSDRALFARGLSDEVQFEEEGGFLLRLSTDDGPPQALPFAPKAGPVPTPTIDWTSLRARNSVPNLHIFQGHQGAITALAYSPDGRFVVSGGLDGSLHLWDVTSGRELRVLMGHVGSVTDVAWSPDGRSLASGGEDHTVRIWDAVRGLQLRQLSGHPETLQRVAFLPDGRQILSGCRLELRLWRLDTGAELRRIYRAGRDTTAPLLSPDGRLVLADDKGKLQAWDALSGKLLRTVAPHVLESPQLSADGRTLVARSGGALDVIDVETGTLLRRLGIDPLQAQFSPAGDAIALIAKEYLVILSPQTGRILKSLSTGALRLRVARFSPGGKTLVVGSDTGQVLEWNLETNEVLRPFQMSDRLRPTALALRPDGLQLLTADRHLVLWDVAYGRALRVFKDPKNPQELEPVATSASPVVAARTYQQVALSTDGRVALSSASDHSVQLWDATTGLELKTLQNPRVNAAGGEAVSSLAISADGRLGLVGHRGGVVKVWRLETGALLHSLELQQSIHTVRFSPDGRYFLTGDGAGLTRLWETQSGVEYRRYQRQSAPAAPAGLIEDRRGSEEVNSVPVAPRAVDLDVLFQARQDVAVRCAIFSRNGRRLATSYGNEINLWDVASGELLQTFKGHQKAVLTLLLDEDGKNLLSGSQDQTVRLWDLKGKQLQTFSSPGDRVLDAAFTGNGRLMVSAGGDGTLRFWLRERTVPLASLMVSSGTVRNQSGVGHQVAPSSVTVSAEGFINHVGQQGLELASFVRGMEILGLTQLYETYYRPGLLAGLLKGQNLPAPTRSGLLQLQPLPHVEILSPHTGERVEQECVPVQAQARDQGGGARNLQLFVNGKRAEDAESPVARQTREGVVLEQSFQACLVSGENRLKVTATNADGIQSPADEVLITLEDSDQKPTLHLVAIGVSRYASARYNLQYPEADARSFVAAVQRATPLFGDVKTHLLLNEQATRAGIHTALETVAAEARGRDQVLVFFAGHGLMTEARKYFFIAHEVPSMTDEDLAAHGISSAELAAFVRQCKAQKIALFLDTCHAGGALEDIGRVAMRGGQVVEEERIWAKLAKTTGSFVLAGSTSAALAAESNQYGHGLFTYTVLEALDGKAGCNPTTVACVQRYAEQRLPELYRALKMGEQSPTGFRFGDDFVLLETSP